MRRLRVSRDTIIFVSGLAGIGFETIAEHGERPTLLVLFAAMIGLPAFLRTDERQAKATEDARAMPPETEVPR